MSVATTTYDQAYALYTALEQAHYAVVRMSSGAQMPGAPIADNADLTAEYDALIGALTTASAAVAQEGDTFLLSDGDTVDVDGTDYTVAIVDGVVTYTAV